MFPKLFTILVLLFVIQNAAASSSTIERMKKLIDISSSNVSRFNSSYYNPINGVGLKAELENIRNPFSSRISFRGLSCTCQELGCNCCAGVNITTIKFNQLACTKFVRVSEESGFNVTLTMNNNQILTTSMSLRNPPPLCIPFRYLPFLSFCIRFYDIYKSDIPKYLHTCIDLETRTVAAPILVLHFNCVQISASGINWIKPQNTTSQMDKPEQQVEEPMEYDDVDFEQADLEAYANYTSTLTPEEEAQIGQLKL